MPISAKKFLQVAKRGGAAFCLGLFLVIQSMAVVPSLHAWFHQDANNPSHECAVTLLLHGQVHTPTADVKVAQSLPLVSFLAPVSSVSFISADVRLHPSRGPPA